MSKSGVSFLVLHPNLWVKMVVKCSAQIQQTGFPLFREENSSRACHDPVAYERP